MSCRERSTAATPDWPALLRHRFSQSATPPAGLVAALEHAATCTPCRRAALSIDPTLVFRRLAELTGESPEGTGKDGWDADSAAMRVAVHQLIRVRQVTPTGSRGWSSVRRMALAAGLASLIGGGLAFRSFSPPAPTATMTESMLEAAALAPRAVPAVFGAAPAIEDWRLSPIVESIERSDARVYELGAAKDGLSVTMIVDASFDV